MTMHTLNIIMNVGLFGALGANGYLLFRNRKLFITLLALDHYLMMLAIMSAADHHRSIYFAWHKTMGEIEVQVKSGRYHWDRDEEWEQAKRR